MNSYLKKDSEAETYSLLITHYLFRMTQE